MMPWLLVGLAGVVLVLAAVAATGRLGQMPEPPVEDAWIDPAEPEPEAGGLDEQRAGGSGGQGVGGPGGQGAGEGQPGADAQRTGTGASAVGEDSLPGPATPGADPSAVSLRDTG